MSPSHSARFELTTEQVQRIAGHKLRRDPAIDHDHLRIQELTERLRRILGTYQNKLDRVVDDADKLVLRSLDHYDLAVAIGNRSEMAVAEHIGARLKRAVEEWCETGRPRFPFHFPLPPQPDPPPRPDELIMLGARLKQIAHMMGAHPLAVAAADAAFIATTAGLRAMPVD